MATTLEQGNTPKVLDDEYYRKEEEENFAFAMQLVGSSALPTCLKSVIELGVFDIIAKAGEGAMLSPAEIAAQLPNTNPEAPIMLDFILRLLASYSVLGCSSASDGIKESNFQWLYSLSPVSKYFVTNEDGVSLGPLMVMIQDKIFMDSGHEIKNAVLEGGIPFNKFHGMHAFEYPTVDPRFNQVFNTGMYNHTTLIIKNILKFYKGFEHLKQLVDVGGGLGVALYLISSKYPHIKGINFDLPRVIKHAPFYPGVEHVGGDMFESVPSGDAIFMKWILHDWSDEKCLKLLKNYCKAIPDNDKVIVVEAILPTVMSETSSAVKTTFIFDVGMMVQNPGGKERSREEFLALATGAGFSGVRFECFVSNFWVMEFFK